MDIFKSVLRELFVTYWNQIIILIGFIVGVIKWRLDLKAKKIESSHSFFQKNKLEAVANFINIYTEVFAKFHHLSLYKIFDDKKYGDEYDREVWPLLNKLIGAKEIVSIYLNDIELDSFQKISDNLMTLNAVFVDSMSSSYMYEGQERNSKINEIFFDRQKLLKANTDLLKVISATTRKNYYS